MLQLEGQRRRAEMATVDTLSNAHCEGLGRRCASFRRLRTALHCLAACCLFACAVVTADTVIAAPSGTAVAGALDVQHTFCIIDNILQQQ